MDRLNDVCIVGCRYILKRIRGKDMIKVDSAIEKNYSQMANRTKSEMCKKSYKQINKEEQSTLMEEQKVKSTDVKDQMEESYKMLVNNSCQIRKYIEEQTKKLKDRIKKGEDAPKIQIGAGAMTQKEWDSLMNKIDKALEEIKRQREVDEVKRDEEKLRKKEQEKKKLHIAREELVYLSKAELKEMLDKLHELKILDEKLLKSMDSVEEQL